MKDIARKPPLRREALNPNQYLLSLLNEARRVKLLSPDDIENIQLQIMAVLKEMIVKHNGAMSSSVRVEVAQNIMLSIVYCLDALCKSIDDPEECLALLRVTSMKEIHQRGLELVESWVEESWELYGSITIGRIQTPLVAYNTTIDKALPDFLAAYDPVFGAHDTMADIDYPLAFDDMDGKGIAYIRQYLEKLNMENQFCRCFPQNAVDLLLENYGRIYRIDYPEYLLNLFEIILANSIFLSILRKDPQKLVLAVNECEALQARLRQLEMRQVPSLVNEAVDRLIGELNLSDPSLIAYIHQYESELSARIIGAIKHGGLDKLIITDNTSDMQAEIIFEQGEIMTDDDFRFLVEQLMECAGSSKKVEIIQGQVKSLSDFLDILNADCLFDDEYLALFAALGDMELSTLARIIFNEELRDQRVSLAQDISRLPESESEWINYFIKFLHAITVDRLHEIEILVNTPSEFI